MKYVQGEILTKNGFIRGYLGFDQKRKLEYIQNGVPPEKPIAKGLILPTFINAHTHLGDSFIRFKHIKLPCNVKDLVAPPNGLKHRLLKETSEQEILNGIRLSLKQMTISGTSCFCDFREGGLIGIYQLKKAMKNFDMTSVILSRPSQMIYNKEELDKLLQNSEGIGLSSISDWDFSEIEKIAKHVRKKKKLFALHASEVVRENIDQILDLQPDLLVHMIAANQADLDRVKDAEIPIVVCPRSYIFFHLKNNLKLMKEIGLNILLGTDNAMINTPEIIQEVKVLLKTKLFNIEELLTNITYTPRKVLNLEDCIQGRDLSGKFIVLEKKSLKLVYVSN